MAPTAGFLAQSESKKRFFDRLGLDERNKLHRHLYSNMKAEAVEGWSRISANRKALIPPLRDDPTIEPPYTFGQIDEDAVHDEVMYIFRNARKDTRIMYELGRDRDGDVEENWIIRWLLWHVFRYRDDRNVGAGRRRAVGDNGEELDATLDASSDLLPGADLARAATSHVTAVTTQPAGHSEPQSSRLCSRIPLKTGSTPAPVATSRYFDPVRDLFRT